MANEIPEADADALAELREFDGWTKAIDPRLAGHILAVVRGEV